MKKLHVFADIHWGSSKALNYTPDDVIKFDIEARFRGEEVYLIGDNFDLKNTRKKELTKYHLEYEKVKRHFGDRMIDGNHSGLMVNSDQIVERDIVIDGKRLHLIHGHRVY